MHARFPLLGIRLPYGAAVALWLLVPHVAAGQTVAAPQERGGLGVGIGYASYATSYWFYGGGHSAWIAWNQAQAIAFYEGRFLRLGALPTRWRLEARLGTGSAKDNVGAGYVGNGASLTNGCLSGVLGASVRLPLDVGSPTSPKPYVGLGLDFGVLWGFGDKSASIYGNGWAEYVLTMPLVAGLVIRTASLTFRPEVRFALLGSSSSDLHLSGAGDARQNKSPSMFGVFVSVSRN